MVHQELPQAVRMFKGKPRSLKIPSYTPVDSLFDLSNARVAWEEQYGYRDGVMVYRGSFEVRWPQLAPGKSRHLIY